jgi:hypothetical protein
VAASQYAQDSKDCRSAAKTWDAVKSLLLHKHMSAKLVPPDCPQDLRLEQVYTLDLHRLLEEHRNGWYGCRLLVCIFTDESLASRYIYTNIILPLTEGWEVPAVSLQLRQHLLIYMADVCASPCDMSNIRTLAHIH